MLNRIVRTSLAHPRFVLLGALLLVIYGVQTLVSARYDVFPDFVPAQASIQTEAPGLSPAQVEAFVTRPLENVINGANGVAAVRSESIQGLSVIDVTFVEGSDPYKSRQIVGEAIAEVGTQLPPGVQPPQLSPLTSSTMDLLKVGFTGGKSPMALRDFVQWTVRPRILATRGVARASLFGGDERRIEVRVRPHDLVARGLALSDLAAAVRAVTQPRGGGYAETQDQRLIVEPSGSAVSPEAIAAAPVALGNGTAVRIGDVADVVLAAAPKAGDALVMGEPGVLINMSSQYGANTLETTRRVEAVLRDLEPAVRAEGITMTSNLHRPATFIETALGGIEKDLLIGTFLIGVVLILFLRNWRVTLIVFTAIPLSLLAALIVLDKSGQAVNTMTLGGLAVALGVVIDDAIVDVENIVRRLRMAGAEADRRAVIASASVEVRAPVVYATFVLAATVMPILFLTGIQGSFFRPLAAAFVIAVLASLVVAMTVAPALCLLLIADQAQANEPGFVQRLKDRHAAMLETLLPRTRGAIFTTLLAALGAATAMASFGGELLPQFRERHFVLQLSGPVGASLPWTRDIGARMIREIRAMPEVATAEQQIGRAEAAEDTWPPSRSEIHVRLRGDGPVDEEAVQARLRAVLERYPMMHGEVVTFLGDRISESLSGETAKVAINVFGPDLSALDRTAAQIAAVMKTVPGAADVQVKSAPGTPTIAIALDPQRMTAHGVSGSDANDAIEAAHQGLTISQITEADRITPVALTLADAELRQPEAVSSVLVRANDGSAVPLGEIATISVAEGRSTIEHQGGLRRQVVTANPEGTDVTGFVARARRAIAAQVSLPAGVTLDFTGAAEAQQAASREILINVAVAAILVVALLMLAFGGGRPAVLILATAPFAMIGGVAAVALTGGVLSLGAIVGFVTLFGISARNAILLIAHVDHLVTDESAPRDAATVLRAARERLTPILMTALVAGLGLAPLALEAGQAGREIQGPMAAVILGGLVTSTLASLVLLPALILAYLWPENGPVPEQIGPSA